MKKMKKKWKSAAIIGGSLPSIYDLTNKPLEAGLWCLCVAKEVYKYKHDYFSCEDIGTILQEYLAVQEIKLLRVGAMMVTKLANRVKNI